MDVYHWKSYVKRIIAKTDQRVPIRKFIDNALNSQGDNGVAELSKKSKLHSNKENTELFKFSYGSIGSSNDSRSTKRVTLNLSDDQIKDNDSNDYLTPISNPRFRLPTKTYNLPETKRPRLVRLNNEDLNEVDKWKGEDIYASTINRKKSNNGNADASRKQSEATHTNQIYTPTEELKLSGRSSRDSFDSISPIRGNLKSINESLNETEDTSLNCTLSPESKSVKEKFVVNLYESRSSKRWKKDKIDVNQSDIIQVPEKPLIDFSFNEPQPKTKPNFNENLLNVISNTVIYEVINDINISAHNEYDESFFKKAFGSIEKVDDWIEDEIGWSSQDLFGKYKEETEMQCQVMIETTKVLQKCRKMKKFYGSTVHVEAERILLLASLKHNWVTEKILKNQYEYLSNAKVASGNVRLDNIKFYLKNASIEKIPNWFVCVVQCNGRIFISKVTQIECNKIILSSKFLFKKLDWNFEIAIKLYCMRLKLKNTKRKWWLIKKENQYLLRLLRHRDLRTNAVTESYITNSSFQLCASTKIQMNHVSEGVHVLPLYQKTPWLEDDVHFDAHLQDVVFQMRWSGFLTIGKDRIGYIVWNRRWCVVDGHVIKFYNYPSDEDFSKPVETINLRHILYPYIVAADRSTCPRPRTVLLHIGKARKRFQHYISADTIEDMNEFKHAVEDISWSLKKWKMQTFSDDDYSVGREVTNDN